MATKEHLDLLRQGVDAWNAWRHKEPSIRPDLSGVETLAGADLSGADLSGANLSEADLSEADLSQATSPGRS